MSTSLLAFAPIDIVLMVSAFGLVFCIWIVALLLWHSRKRAHSERIERRLGLIEERGTARVLRLWHEGKEVVTTVPWSRYRLTLWGYMKRLHRESGLSVPISSTLLGIVGVSLGAFVVGYGLTGRALAGIGGLIIVPLGFWMYLGRRIRNQSNLLERQLVDAMDLAARSLRAGHPLNGAFRLISDEVDLPIREVFAEIVQETELGISLEQALREAAAKSPSQDFKLFAASVSIQMHTGGNLADMMERLASVIRDRIRLGRRVKVLTSQTQLSKRILIALPLVIFVALNMLNPAYMEPLYTTSAGQILLLVTAGMLVLGAWIMNRLCVLRF